MDPQHLGSFMGWIGAQKGAYFDDFVALTSLKVMIMIMMLLMPDLAEVWSDGLKAFGK